MTLNHIHFGTKNLDKIQNFYEKYFGFARKSEHGNGVFLTDKKGFLIAIDLVAELPILPDWYHLGFCLDSAFDVLKIYDEMTSNSENIVRPLRARENEFASFFVKDPDGNKIEVSWHNE